MGFIYFLILTFPSKTNDNFPFHVTTTHIGIASDKSETQNYPHHDEGESGNKKFNDSISIQNIFITENRQHKYVVESETN